MNTFNVGMFMIQESYYYLVVLDFMTHCRSQIEDWNIHQYFIAIDCPESGF